MENRSTSTSTSLTSTKVFENSLYRDGQQSKRKIVKKEMVRKKVPAIYLAKILNEWNQHAVRYSKLRLINIKITLRLLWSMLAEWTIEARVSQIVKRRMKDLSKFCQEEMQTFEEFGSALRRSVDLANCSVAVLSQTLEITCQRLLHLPRGLGGSECRGLIVSPLPGNMHSVPVLQVPLCFIEFDPFCLTQCIFLAGPAGASSAIECRYYTLACLRTPCVRAS